ncbi:MAG: hypothetical protein IMZ55_07425 [Acidobacteria bacterium]|nr:hypothetical protein [Acidobacteriota bacterium]
MPTTLSELIDSREYSGGTVTMHYTLTGTADDAAAYAALLAGTATTYNGKVREVSPTCTPIAVDTVTGTGTWDCTVRYRPPGWGASESGTEVALNTVRIRGSIKGVAQHIVVAKDTISAYGVGAGVNDYGDLIGANGTGAEATVEGADIDAAVFEFTVTKTFPPTALPNLGTLYAIKKAPLNDAGWTFTDSVTGQTIALYTGECRLIGVDFGEVRSDGGMEFVFSFLASPNVVDQTVGPITVLALKGHELLWVRYDPATIAGPPSYTVQKPARAYVCKVYDSSNYTGLGVGAANGLVQA